MRRYLSQIVADGVQGPDADIPVMLVSTSATEAQIARGLECGAIDYVVKPFRRDDLLARIDTALTKTPSAPPRPGAVPRSLRS